MNHPLHIRLSRLGLCLLLGLQAAVAAAGTATVYVRDAAVTEGHGDVREIRFPIEVRRAGFDGPVQLEWEVRPSGQPPVQATAEVDFRGLGGVLRIAEGERDGNLVVAIYGDRVPELDEQFAVEIVRASCTPPRNGEPCAVRLGDARARGVIVNDERAALPGAFLDGLLQGDGALDSGSCLALGGSVDGQGAGAFCQALFARSPGGRLHAGKGFTASTRFPGGALTGQGLLVLPEDGRVEVEVDAWEDRDGDGAYRPYGGPLAVSFHDSDGSGSVPARRFTAEPVRAQPGRFVARVPADALAAGGYSVYVDADRGGHRSPVMRLKDLLVETGDQRAIAIADALEARNPDGPFTPVYVMRRAARADRADLCPLELLSAGIEGRDQDPVACIAEAHASCLSGSPGAPCFLPGSGR